MSTGDLFVAAPAAPRSELESVAFAVLGTPSPKGSMRAFVVGKVNPRAVITHGNDSDGLKLWSALVAQAARAAMDGRVMFVDRPLVVNVTFYMPRPGGHFTPRGVLKKSAPRFPHHKPDMDKLMRSTWDALTSVVFDDDSRVVSTVTSKLYETVEQPRGALITVREMASPASDTSPTRPPSSTAPVG
jgi:Holliday junction resolvase RusA-like endonuclease